jgi:hypothetical protein
MAGDSESVLALPAQPKHDAEASSSKKKKKQPRMCKAEAKHLWRHRQPVPCKGSVHLPTGWVLSSERIPLPPNQGFRAGQRAPPAAPPAAPSRILPHRRVIRRRRATAFAEPPSEPVVDAEGNVCIPPLRTIPPPEDVINLD